MSTPVDDKTYIQVPVLAGVAFVDVAAADATPLEAGVARALVRADRVRTGASLRAVTVVSVRTTLVDIYSNNKHTATVMRRATVWCLACLLPFLVSLTADK